MACDRYSSWLGWVVVLPMTAAGTIEAGPVAVDANGSAVITGVTRNPNFPLKNAFQTQYETVYGTSFVTKLSPDGRSLVYSSYIGGSTQEVGGGDHLRGVGS